MLIRRPLEEVFDFVADERTDRSCHRKHAALGEGDGPIGLGTRFRATIRAGRRTLPMDIEYTGFDRPHLIASNTRMSNSDFSRTHTFTPAALDTPLSWSWQTCPKGVLRVLAPVLTPVGARQERQMWTRLRGHLETADGAR